MERIERVWNRAEQLAVGILGALALLAGLMQVLGRYIAPRFAITWAEEAIVYLLVWAVMIIASQLVRTDGHVRPDLVLRLLPPRWQRRVEICNCLVALAFCALLVWYGWDIVDMAMMLDQRSPTDLQFPMWVYDAALPCGRRADGPALPAAPGAVRLPLRPGHHGDRPLAGPRGAAGRRHAMTTVLFLLLFFGLLAAGMPIFLVLGALAACLYSASGQGLVGVAQTIIDELNSPSLMALPLFVMAAAFMRHGGVAKALVAVATAWMGGCARVVGPSDGGGLHDVSSAICGSSVATALAMGTILLPAMLARGYPRSFALGVIGASGTIGIVIPPSLPLILYGIVAEQSVPRLFLAGILPGILQAAAFFGWVWFYARRKNFPREPSLPFAERLRVTWRAVPALAVPAVVLVGIYGGLLTVTEAAAIAAVRVVAGQPVLLPRLPPVANARGHRRRPPQRRHHHADRRDRVGVRALDDPVRRPRRRS